MKPYIILCIIFVTLVPAKVPFYPKHISKYLTKENPFVYDNLAKEQIDKQKVRFYEGNFDTKLSAKYDNKDYALTQGEFLEFNVAKPIENGMDFLLGYRKATGVQEYNNIKTGNDGEIRMGVKIPVSSVIAGVNERELQLKTSRLENKKLQLNTQNNLQKFYYKIVSEYYKLLYQKNLLSLELNLLDTAKKRMKFVQKRVKNGLLPKVSFIEVNQQILNRKQRFVHAKNALEKNIEIFVMYLGIKKNTFEKVYTIPKLKKHVTLPSLSKAIKYAIRNRPDLLIYDYKLKQQEMQKGYVKQLNYPDVNVELYGLHDIQHGNGYKVSVNMDFPLERRKFEGKNEEVKMKIMQIENQKEMKISTIKSTLSYLINSMKNLQTNLYNSQKEINAAKKLEKAELKKYTLGLSTLFLVNLREISTLEIRKKYLYYLLELKLLSQAIKVEMGKKIPYHIQL